MGKGRQGNQFLRNKKNCHGKCSIYQTPLILIKKQFDKMQIHRTLQVKVNSENKHYITEYIYTYLSLLLIKSQTKTVPKTRLKSTSPNPYQPRTNHDDLILIKIIAHPRRKRYKS